MPPSASVCANQDDDIAETRAEPVRRILDDQVGKAQLVHSQRDEPDELPFAIDVDDVLRSGPRKAAAPGREPAILEGRGRERLARRLVPDVARDGARKVERQHVRRAKRLVGLVAPMRGHVDQRGMRARGDAAQVVLLEPAAEILQLPLVGRPVRLEGRLMDEDCRRGRVAAGLFREVQHAVLGDEECFPFFKRAWVGMVDGELDVDPSPGIDRGRSRCRGLRSACGEGQLRDRLDPRRVLLLARREGKRCSDQVPFAHVLSAWATGGGCANSGRR